MSIDRVSKSSVLITGAGIGGFAMDIEGRAPIGANGARSKVCFGFIGKYGDVKPAQAVVEPLPVLSGDCTKDQRT